MRPWWVEILIVTSELPVLWHYTDRNGVEYWCVQ